MKSLHVILGMLVLILADATAQEARRIKFRAVCLAHAGEVKKVRLLAASQPVEIDLITGDFTREAEATVAGGTLRFALPDAGADGEPEVVATVDALEGERHLLVFVPGTTGERTYRVLAIDDSEAAFPMGSSRLINLAPAKVRFTIGENSRELASGGTGDLPLPKKLNSMNQCPVQAAIAEPGGEWRVFSSTRWHATLQERSLVITFIDPSRGRPAFRRWADVPPWRRPKLD
ncbi:hypothetical protein OKA04_22575 [Luteolibacter flavescens]|uniref:Uncharacterized protein n=1 Tax=Luteolibacter flavescens TaxID=1859460 RepID=A0ABT3FWD3_9BACT|nr:hypothetical protein [Luteolibacter flavescens]MCW1887539.1 hypothetical protein [Luteolibacter flavescens]